MATRLFWPRTVLVAAICAVLTGTASAQVGRLSGIIKDDGGQPVKGATVTAQFLDGDVADLTATTDEKGRFTMVGLRLGEWTFITKAAGYLGQNVNLRARAVGANPPLFLTLRKAFVAPSPLGEIPVKDVQADLTAADELYTSGRWDEAIAAYRNVLAQAPMLKVVDLQIGAAFRNKKDFDSAIAAYGDLLSAEPDNAKAMVGIAMASLERGDVASAERSLAVAADAPTATREIFFSLGEIERSKPDTAAAARAYERALQLDPSWGKPAFALAELEMAQSDTAGAARHFEQVVSVDPASPEAAQAKSYLQQISR